MDMPEQFGRYRILRKLGAGGMGTVYLAQDTTLGRPVALKVPHFDTRDGETAQKRFLREARAAATLDHPNICHVHDIGEIDGRPYITMAYVEGQSLSELVDPDSPLAQAKAAGIVRRLALALAQAHAKGIVHRDLKPSNVMLRPDGEPVILDFGLARMPTSDQSRLTVMGAKMGTPVYMAPEQVRGQTQAIDARTDVYALGVMLYELLTGQLPFGGPPEVVYMQVLQMVPDRPSSLRRDLDPRLEAICLKAIAKDAAQRYATMGQLAEALDAWTNEATSRQTVARQAKAAPTRPAKRVGSKATQAAAANPATKAERRDTIDAAKAGRTIYEDGRRDMPRKSIRGGIPNSILAAAGVVLVVACAGGLYWAISGGRHARNQSSSEDGRPFVITALGGMKEAADTPRQTTDKGTGAGGAGAPKTDVVAKVRNISGIDLVSIPQGSFYMGAPNNEEGAYDDEKPQHKVTISNSFYMGKCKVTVGQFRRFVNATGYKTEAEKDGDKWTWYKPGFEDRGFNQADDHPVICVSGNDANAFCKWLADKTGASVRLPYEAEWEYSCRSVTEARKPTTKFYFGDDDEKLGDYAWYSGNSGSTTQPCGDKTPNPFLLYDMHGLVFEWCADGRRKYEDSDETDPKGPMGTGKDRMARGGAFDRPSRHCRAAFRFDQEPSFRNAHFGFRVLVSR
jgi:formylglycine-generating enzyme required for sulfatase activity/predicted Ser/Thr protein kinase